MAARNYGITCGWIVCVCVCLNECVDIFVEMKKRCWIEAGSNEDQGFLHSMQISGRALNPNNELRVNY